MVSGDARDESQGNLGGYLAEGQEEAAVKEGHSVGADSRDSGGRRAGGWRC